MEYIVGRPARYIFTWGVTVPFFIVMSSKYDIIALRDSNSSKAY